MAKREDVKRILSSAPLLSALPERIVDVVCGMSEELVLETGAVLFRAGEKASDFYILIAGQVQHPEVAQEIAGPMVRRAVGAPGEIFGYAAFLDLNATRVISAVAAEPTSVLKVDGPAFRAALLGWGQEGHELLQTFARRFAAHEHEVAKRAGWVSVRNAGKVYDPKGKAVVAVDDCSIEIRPGEFCAIVGPSGCGKSTLLNAIAGFDGLTTGEITLDGEVINRPRMQPRPGPDRIVVFQNGALFPWASVRENLIRAPVIRGAMTEREALGKARQLLERVGLADVEDLYPGAISSGMCRRVEIIRAILNEPRVILLDEPFRGLDALTKTVTQTALLELYDMTRKTVLFITHDLEEAIYLADRVLVMTTRPGRFKQTIAVDLPRPRNAKILTSPEFIALKEQAIEAVHEEAVKAFAAGEKEFA